MRRILLAALCVAPLLLSACNQPLHVEDPPALAEVYFHHMNINSAVTYELRISPTGDMAFQVQVGTDAPKRAAGRLTPDQMAALYNAFKGWGRLDPYYPGDWTNTIQLTYNGYKVEVHDELQAPPLFRNVEDLLRTYLNQALQAATQPAASPPATRATPATAPQN
jgi:hypothetical protein